MEDEEWEDVIVVSYVPLPITCEENVNHGKFKAIERDLTVEAFELKETSKSSHDARILFAWSKSKTELALVSVGQPTEPWIYDRTAKYKHTGKTKLDPGQIRNQREAADPSGKYTIVCQDVINLETRVFQAHRISRIDHQEGSISQICEVDYFSNYHAQEVLHVNHKWAYVIAERGFWRVDWRSDNLGNLGGEREKYFTNWPDSHSSIWNLVDIASPTQDSVYFSFLMNHLMNNKIAFVKILKFSQKKRTFVHGAECSFNHGSTDIPNIDLKVIKEGLVIKTTSQTPQRFYSVTRLYSLSDLRLRAVFRSQLSSMYPVLMKDSKILRIKGIPVFLDSLDKEGRKHLLNFIFLYGNRFHGMTFKTTMQTSGVERLLDVRALKGDGQFSEVVLQILYGGRFGERTRKLFVLQIGL